MALGRGLDALLGDTTLQAQTGGSVNLPISQVEPGLNQPRKHFDEEALADLAESIRQHGMLQPLTVRRLASGYYQIIAGERRWRAARQAGLEEVPAIIIEADDRKVMELGLIENLQREDLNPMEEAAGLSLIHISLSPHFSGEMGTPPGRRAPGALRPEGSEQTRPPVGYAPPAAQAPGPAERAAGRWSKQTTPPGPAAPRPKFHSL